MTVIVCGGTFQKEVALPLLNTADYIIAADAGLISLASVAIKPDEIIGDFDSANMAMVEDILDEFAMDATKLNPIKDDTDSEAALKLAFEKGEGDIYILAGTGTRLDHVLANISLLLQGIENNRKVYLLDANNRIQVIDEGESISIQKEKQYGKYISVFPVGDTATISLEGFFYPLNHHVLSSDTSLGVSNEITAEKAIITSHKGRLIVMETRD